MVLPDGAESDTVKVAVVTPASPSVTDRSSIVTTGDASSSTIVPIPVASAIEAPDRVRQVDRVGLVELVEGVAATSTSTVLETWPGAKVTVVETAA